MRSFLIWIQIITCLILIISVLLQDSKNAPQISQSSSNQSYFKPRGKEAFLNNVTKLSGITLFTISVLSLIIK